MAIVARITQQDVFLATAYLATKAQYPKVGDYKAALLIISYPKSTTSQDIVVNCRELKFHQHFDASGHSTETVVVILDGSLNSASASLGRKNRSSA